MRYYAFISYSHRDEKFATWLMEAIETYKVPRQLVGKQGRLGEVAAPAVSGLSRSRRAGRGGPERAHHGVAGGLGFPGGGLLAGGGGFALGE